MAAAASGVELEWGLARSSGSAEEGVPPTSEKLLELVRLYLVLEERRMRCVTRIGVVSEQLDRALKEGGPYGDLAKIAAIRALNTMDTYEGRKWRLGGCALDVGPWLDPEEYAASPAPFPDAVEAYNLALMKLEREGVPTDLLPEIFSGELGGSAAGGSDAEEAHEGED